MKKTRLRIAGLALAGAAFVGGGIAADASVSPVVAEAKAASSTQYCNWPYRAAIQFRTNPSGQFIAYSPGGAYLGSKGASTPQTITWYTPWEDVRFVSGGYIAWYSTWCYW